MAFLPAVVEAESRGEFRIHLVFNDRSESTVDFEPWLDGPVFEPLKTVSYFRRFFIEGGTIVWPNGADIDPDVLYQNLEPDCLEAIPTQSAPYETRA